MARCPKQAKKIVVIFSVCSCSPQFAPNKQLPQLTRTPLYTVTITIYKSFTVTRNELQTT
jgi:hypothetical protein